MNRQTLLGALLAGALLAAPAAARADTALTGQPTAAEQPFVTQATADLKARYPTAADAVKGGYIRYTDEDETGAISYANRVWTSADSAHPSQLWYDVKGKLLGADYSVPLTEAAPTLWGVDPSRWQTFHAHVHYGLRGPAGMTTYGATGAQGMAKGGGTVDHPTAQALVGAGIAKRASDVKFVFAFPAIWDLQLWVVPNPMGAFAESNPNVKPAHGKAMNM
jgi:hypothetical protein